MAVGHADDIGCVSGSAVTGPRTRVMNAGKASAVAPAGKQLPMTCAGPVGRRCWPASSPCSSWPPSISVHVSPMRQARGDPSPIAAKW